MTEQDLHDVTKSECETVVTDEGSCEDVGGTLPNRTEEKEFCDYCRDDISKCCFCSNFFKGKLDDAK